MPNTFPASSRIADHANPWILPEHLCWFHLGFGLGIDSDNDSVFINETLVQYCADRGIEFTRSWAYRSNDQAWIEQKNGSVVRRFVGHDR